MLTGLPRTSSINPRGGRVDSSDCWSLSCRGHRPLKLTRLHTGECHGHHSGVDLSQLSAGSSCVSADDTQGDRLLSYLPTAGELLTGASGPPIGGLLGAPTVDVAGLVLVCCAPTAETQRTPLVKQTALMQALMPPHLEESWTNKIAVDAVLYYEAR